MAFIDDLMNGGQMQQQYVPQMSQPAGPQDMVQGILSARQPPALPGQQQQSLVDIMNSIKQMYQPNWSDVANAATQTFANKGVPVSPEVAMAQRMAPSLEAAKTFGSLGQQQMEFAKINEQMRHDRVMEASNTNALPITDNPTTPQMGFGGGMPAQASSMSQTSLQMPQQAPQGGMPGFGQGAQTQMLSAPQQSQSAPAQTPAQQSGLTPQFRGNQPYTEGLQPGFQWAKNSDGRLIAMQIPGTIQKGENGKLITMDVNGKPTETMPIDPVAKQKFESNIQLIAQKFDELHKIGGTVEENGGFLNNKKNQLESTKDWAWGKLPGGQSLMQGRPEQTIRGEIQDLVKQTMPLYMQAMGITPGMERAVAAQQMLQEALGGSISNTRQQNLFSLSNLSKQAGTGAFASQLEGQQQLQSIPAPAVEFMRQNANDPAIKQQFDQKYGTGAAARLLEGQPNG